MPGEHISQEQADEYAIGSLEPPLERTIALHLAECAACRDIARDSERLVATYAMTSPRRQAPPRLKNKVFLAAGIRRPSPLRRAFNTGRALAGVAAVFVAIAAFTGMVWMRSQLDDLRQDDERLQAKIQTALSQEVEIAALTRKLDDQQKEAERLSLAATGDQELIVALLSNNTKIADVIPAEGGLNSIGRLVWDDDQKRVWFVASDLPQRPPGETYQLWANSGGKNFSLGTFESDADGFARYQTVIPGGIASYDVVLVTIERAGGSPTLEGPTVFFVQDLSKLKN
ncbi:MAG: anti-sigma factor [Dehalococcoidia bacterium]